MLSDVLCYLWRACIVGEGGVFLFLSATIRDFSCLYAMMSKNAVEGEEDKNNVLILRNTR
jgi:hypothetical protein